jgi:hypothetical protein
MCPIYIYLSHTPQIPGVQFWVLKSGEEISENALEKFVTNIFKKALLGHITQKKSHTKP